MKFKRKWWGYHREECDKYIEQVIERNNHALEEQEELLVMLSEECKDLNKETQRLAVLLGESKQRNESLHLCNTILETFFLSIEKEAKMHISKILALSNNIASDLRNRNNEIKSDTVNLENSIGVMKNQLLDELSAVRSLLDEHLQEINQIPGNYLPLDEIIVSDKSDKSESESSETIKDEKTEKMRFDVKANSYPDTPISEAAAALDDEEDYNDISDAIETIPPIENSSTADTFNEQKTIKALIVDDDPTILAMLNAILDRENILVSEASDGNMASDMIDEMEPPDIIVLDIMLPYMDGLQLVKKIRGLEKWKTKPVIMLTSKSSEDEIVKLLKAGANDYITKPFNTRELITRIKKLINN